MGNKIKKRLYCVEVLFFVSLFIYQSHVALEKYLDKNTSQHSKIEVSLSFFHLLFIHNCCKILFLSMYLKKLMF